MVELIKRYCKGDKYMWGAISMLVFISILSVYSSCTTLAYQHNTDVASIIFKHGMMLVAGVVVMAFFSNISPKYFSGFSVFALLVGIMGVVVAMLMGSAVNGSSRWLMIGGISIQPSELVKIALMLYVCKQLAINNTDPDRAYWPIVIAVGASCGLVMLENLSTCLLMATTCGIMMFVGRISFSKLGITVLVLAAFLAIVITLAPYTESYFKRAMTWRARIERFMGKDDTVGKSDDYQAHQALMAVSTGGILGKGPGHSYMKNFLPMAASDFIFSIILEEDGMWGCGIIVFCYLVIMGRAMILSRKCEKAFHAYALLGIGFLITIQAMINMFVGVGLFPVTGQTLPMVSQGGSSNVLTGCALGIMLSITHHIELLHAKAQAVVPQKEMEPEEDDELYDEAESAEF